MIIDALSDSLDPEQVRLSPEWTSEIQKRIAAIESGAVELIPGERSRGADHEVARHRVMLLDFHPAAAEEFNEAVSWTEDARAGYGELLLRAVQTVIAQAAEFPESGSRVLDVDAKYDARSHRLRRFRYRVITAKVNGTLVVVAVAHTSREPGYWRERLK